MTYKEIVESINAFRKVQKEKLQQRAVMDFKLAQCIQKNISALISKDNKSANLYEIYGELFKNEIEKSEKDRVKAQLEINKQKMKEFAKYNNERRKKEHGS